MRVYSILGTTLKDEGKLLEAKGPVTDVAYSHDGAFLAVCDASKVVTVFSVADGYSVSRVQNPVLETYGKTHPSQMLLGFDLLSYVFHSEWQVPAGTLGRLLVVIRD